MPGTNKQKTNITYPACGIQETVQRKQTRTKISHLLHSGLDRIEWHRHSRESKSRDHPRYQVLPEPLNVRGQGRLRLVVGRDLRHRNHHRAQHCVRENTPAENERWTGEGRGGEGLFSSDFVDSNGKRRPECLQGHTSYMWH